MSCKTQFHLFIIVMLASVLSLSGCSGDDGTNGTNGTNGAPGVQGDTGDTGTPDGSNVGVTTFHGKEYLESTGEFATAGKYFATATITSAAAAADGTVTVNFTVADEDANPVAGITGVSFNINKLVPAGADVFSKWVPYIYAAQTVSDSASGDWPNPDGTAADQGSSENNGTFTDNGDGSYRYVFSTNLSSVVTPVSATTITYDRTLTHRVSLMMGGHSGATADASFDFVPDGSTVTQTRNIVETSVCQSCHGSEFHGHGGNRLTVENCVTCHNPSTTDPHSGNTVDFKVMIHKIHAGGELASIPGPDGIVWDTGAGESADNGEYAIWGYGNTKHEWWKAEFPAVIENCTKCHQETVPSTLAEVDNWKTVPSRAACGSCHDDVDFTDGTNHVTGGPQADDSACSTCHAPEIDVGPYPSVTNAHDWTQFKYDPSNLPEFDVAITVSGAAGAYFVAGESPIVSVSLTDLVTSNLITHNTITAGAAEGCVLDPGPPAICTTSLDNVFGASGLFVHGPRAKRNPVLTTNARVAIIALDQATYDMTGAGNLDITFDGGKDIYDSTSGGTILAGNVSVDLGPYVDVNTGCASDYAVPTAATPAEIMACLNGDSDFAARGIAYIDEGTTRLAIRSRNLGDFYSLQLATSAANTAVFNDTGIHVMGGYTVSATLADIASDPTRITYFADHIEYQLDPVDDLQPGTYMVGVEISDRGRASSSNYKTPSVKKAYFQVKQAAEEKPVANNCDSCHQGPEGTGFVLDYARHNKIFDNTAVDQCGQCHDYQPQGATGSAWGGGKPISKRVHAVHNGANLNYPNLTVDHSDGIAGRNWEINFPQDIRNCETCHPADTTSGTWKTKAARLPCSGCHDSEAARSHFNLMTYDPTPTNPWSGDEAESCLICH